MPSTVNTSTTTGVQEASKDAWAVPARQNGGDMTTEYYYPPPPAQTPAAPATSYAGSQNPQMQQESGWVR
ncbi:hypothetical protein AJ78_02542 [Emergomyces pasteurianus Ep9510]|uniref:Uncharacterized protein n=1 Tax=Emergomyces pasteurianus Ep9510 TaxID=1447872 RepID=A0A1J9QQ29_9EURO|nr:hypothetical protein AJ78_02542 [Emergomyces pasteurianus Ep9510]